MIKRILPKNVPKQAVTGWGTPVPVGPCANCTCPAINAGDQADHQLGLQINNTGGSF